MTRLQFVAQGLLDLKNNKDAEEIFCPTRTLENGGYTTDKDKGNELSLYKEVGKDQFASYKIIGHEWEDTPYYMTRDWYYNMYIKTLNELYDLIELGIETHLTEGFKKCKN